MVPALDLYNRLVVLISNDSAEHILCREQGINTKYSMIRIFRLTEVKNNIVYGELQIGYVWTEN